MAIAAFNQLSGINAIIYYTADIFRMAGYDKSDAMLQSVVVGLTNLVFTMAAMTVIDHFGRRRLMLIGSVGYILSLGAATYAFYTQTGGALVLGSFAVVALFVARVPGPALALMIVQAGALAMAAMRFYYMSRPASRLLVASLLAVGAVLAWTGVLVVLNPEVGP